MRGENNINMVNSLGKHDENVAAAIRIWQLWLVWYFKDGVFHAFVSMSSPMPAARD